MRTGVTITPPPSPVSAPTKPAATQTPNTMGVNARILINRHPLPGSSNQRVQLFRSEFTEIQGCRTFVPLPTIKVSDTPCFFNVWELQ